jgi:hypothetical protein
MRVFNVLTNYDKVDSMFEDIRAAKDNVKQLKFFLKNKTIYSSFEEKYGLLNPSRQNFLLEQQYIALLCMIMKNMFNKKEEDYINEHESEIMKLIEKDQTFRKMNAKDKHAGRDLPVGGQDGGLKGQQDTEMSGPGINYLTSTYRHMSSQPHYTWSSNPQELINSTERGEYREPEISPSPRPRGSINASKLSPRKPDEPEISPNPRPRPRGSINASKLSPRSPD